MSGLGWNSFWGRVFADRNFEKLIRGAQFFQRNFIAVGGQFYL